MRVQFQVIHKLNRLEDLESLVKTAIDLIKTKILEEHEPISIDGKEVPDPMSYHISYNERRNDLYMTGICLDYSNYDYHYYEDYEWIIRTGFEWGAGGAIDEVNDYILSFISFLKDNSKDIIDVIKFSDTNTQLAYWQLSREIYMVEMELREILNCLLFKEKGYQNDLCTTLKENIRFKHKIDKSILLENFENEIFSLDFNHYKKLFQSFPNIFDEEVIASIDNIRVFRNSIMHNKGFTSVGPGDFWEAKKKLIKFINAFWDANRKISILKMEQSL